MKISESLFSLVRPLIWLIRNIHNIFLRVASLISAARKFFSLSWDRLYDWFSIFRSYSIFSRSIRFNSDKSLQRDIVYLVWPIAPSNMSPKAGGGEELRGLRQWAQLYTGAQIIFGDLSPYLTYEFRLKNTKRTALFFYNIIFYIRMFLVPWKRFLQG